MRKLIAIILSFVIILSLIAPVAMAATEPVAIDNTAEVLAETQMNLFIFIGVVVVLAAGAIALIVIKKKALKDEH